jgi:hypothetical protein
VWDAARGCAPVHRGRTTCSAPTLCVSPLLPIASADTLARQVCLAAANDSQYAYETSTAGGLVTAAFVEHASLPEQRLGSLVHAVTVRCVDADVERFDALELSTYASTTPGWC